MAVLAELIGVSPPIVAVREAVDRLLQRQAAGRSLPPILIQGETGTGKGLLAAAIHHVGPRSDGPFVAVNCAAIPGALLEAELFGFERGAFTDARQSKPGLVQAAHRGTLFLDEIGLLPVSLQGKLLTVLEDRAVRRLGRTRSEPVDIAILTATSEDLEEAVRGRRFAEALYHRLAVLMLHLPPLRDRGLDTLLLADHFLARAAADYRVAPRSLTHEACAALLAYSWPGNVRELRNRMERVTLLGTSELVTAPMLGLPERSPSRGPGSAPVGDSPQLRGRMDSLERGSLIEALRATGGNITHAAARLGIPPTTFRYRLKRHELAGAPEAVATRPGAPRRSFRDDLADVPRRGAASAERRQLTVMSCEVMGTEALASDELTETCNALAAMVHGFEGHIAEHRADRLVVYFGYPLAHEDDARRAVHAGLAIVERIQDLNRQGEWGHGPELAVRLGIDTGMVIVDGMVTDDEHERVALGDAPRVAVQLTQVAPPHAIAITQATYRMIEGYFDCEALDVVTPRGVGGGDVYRVLCSTASSRLEAGSANGLTPLVGRDRELGLLLERWEQAKEGRGQVVWLRGEAGIGKSRLVQALQQGLDAETLTTLECRCSAYHEKSALYPVIDGIQRFLQFRREHSPQERLSRLEAALQSHGLDVDEAVPLFAALLSLPLSERYPALTGTPQRRKQKTVEALLAWLLTEADRHVTLCVWEDLQWVDPSTLELLDLLLTEAPTARVLILLTSRPEFCPPWATRAHLTQVPLGRLARTQAESMIERVAGNRAIPDDVLRELVVKTDGVPLFVEELTKAVLESGLLADVGGRYELARPLVPLTIPSTLHDSLMARLDRLGNGKLLAQVGATLGREFSYEMIQAVSSLDEPTLRRELDKLVEADLLHRRGVPPKARFVFKHALIQDAAYQSLLKSTRRHYHRQVARVLEERFPETGEVHPELVAHHYTEAGLTGPAVAYWQKAGERAIGRSASAEAADHLRRGLELLEASPDNPERAQQELVLQLTLGSALLMVKGYMAPEVEGAYARARALRPHVGDSPELFSTLFGLWRFHISRAEVETAHELSQECFALARRLNRPELLREAHFAQGMSALHLGDFASALGDLEQAIELSQPRGDLHPVLHGLAPGVAARCFAARALWFLGYPDRALDRSEEALAFARQSAHPFTLGYALHQVLAVQTYRRNVDGVRRLAEEAIALASDQGFARWLGSGLIRRGWALAQQGSPSEGLEQLRGGLDIWESQLGLSQFLALLAEAWEKAGQPATGLRAVDEALTVAHRTAERHYEAELYRLKGELLLQRGGAGEVPGSLGSDAAACFHRALEIARSRGAKSLELRAVMSLGRLWDRQGDRPAARQLLVATVGWFSEGFATPDLQDATSLLRDLAG